LVKEQTITTPKTNDSLMNEELKGVEIKAASPEPQAKQKNQKDLEKKMKHKKRREVVAEVERRNKSLN